jgi:hypothetical protein
VSWFILSAPNSFIPNFYVGLPHARVVCCALFSMHHFFLRCSHSFKLPHFSKCECSFISAILTDLFIWKNSIKSSCNFYILVTRIIF